MGLEDIFSITVGDIMSNQVLTVPQDATVLEAVQKMDKLNIGSIIIVDKNEKINGVFSERDILRRVVPKDIDPAQTRIADVMTKNPKGLKMNTSIWAALGLMLNLNFRHIPIVADNKLVGIISMRDIIKVLYEHLQKAFFE